VIWKRKLTALPTPAAVVVSGGNIDDSKLEAILASS
jgi:hypothetical protein